MSGLVDVASELARAHDAACTHAETVASAQAHAITALNSSQLARDVAGARASAAISDEVRATAALESVERARNAARTRNKATASAETRATAVLKSVRSRLDSASPAAVNAARMNAVAWDQARAKAAALGRDQTRALTAFNAARAALDAAVSASRSSDLREAYEAASARARAAASEHTRATVAFDIARKTYDDARARAKAAATEKERAAAANETARSALEAARARTKAASRTSALVTKLVDDITQVHSWTELIASSGTQNLVVAHALAHDLADSLAGSSNFNRASALLRDLTSRLNTITIEPTSDSEDKTRAEPPQVTAAATRIVGVASRLLPPADRGRYAEEFQSDLSDLAESGAGRWAQIACAARQAGSALQLRNALRVRTQPEAVP